MKKIIRGIATEYEVRGEGSKMALLLHGWGDSVRGFDKLVTELEGLIDKGSEMKIVRLDLPGFGQSAAPTEAWGVGDYVDFVSEFVNKIGVSPDVIVGHSFGGRIMLKALATGKLSANKIVLIASAGIAKTWTPRTLVTKAITKVIKPFTYLLPKRVRKKLQREWYGKLGSDYISSGYLRDTYLKVIKEDLQKEASQITTPALLVWGSNDGVTPLSDGKKLQELIKGSRLHVIDGATHIVHKEHASEVAGEISKFI